MTGWSMTFLLKERAAQPDSNCDGIASQELTKATGGEMRCYHRWLSFLLGVTVAGSNPEYGSFFQNFLCVSPRAPSFLLSLSLPLSFSSLSHLLLSPSRKTFSLHKCGLLSYLLFLLLFFFFFILVFDISYFKGFKSKKKTKVRRLEKNKFFREEHREEMCYLKSKKKKKKKKRSGRGGNGIWTRGLSHAKRALYHWAIPPGTQSENLIIEYRYAWNWRGSIAGKRDWLFTRRLPEMETETHFSPFHSPFPLSTNSTVGPAHKKPVHCP